MINFGETLDPVSPSIQVGEHVFALLHKVDLVAIILDEPFAFFDRERIRASLAALPKVDKHLDQIWIITQEFEDLSPFALHIECSRENEELIVGQYAG